MYKFNFKNKEYELKEENCQYFYNDVEKPVDGFELENILKLLNEAENVNFDLEYYEEPCENCYKGNKQKSYRFLQYHFYIFTKENNYVISSVSDEYKDTSFNKLLKKNTVDNSYIVNVIVCEECGEYSIEIEECGA